MHRKVIECAQQMLLIYNKPWPCWHTAAMFADTDFTQPCEDRDFADWHQGCPWSAVWVVWLGGDGAEANAVQNAVEQGRQALGPELLPRYDRQPHVTLAYRGLCAPAPGHVAAEYGVAGLRTDVQRLQALAPKPFTLQLHGVGSFTTVPYLAVSQGLPALVQLHDALVPQVPAPGWQYVPHVTLGHYAQKLPLAQVLAQLQVAGVGRAFIDVHVKQLALVRYAPADIAGPLVVEGWYDLQRQHYTAQPGAILLP